MMGFKEFLLSEAAEVNTHLEHAEDEVLNAGLDGAKRAINYLLFVKHELDGHSKGKIRKSAKIDGAPAVFFGKDPSDGKFFVAKKGIFNKTPKIYKTDAEIDEDTSGDLALKLKLALEHFPKLGIDGVVQGDFLFAPADLKSIKMDGVDYLTFHPNTIVYAVEHGSTLEKTIRAAKVGVALHTVYHGDAFENMKAEFGSEIKYKPSKDVFVEVATITDLSGTVTLTDAESKEFDRIIKSAIASANLSLGSILNDILNNSAALAVFKKSINAGVRSGKMLENPSETVDLIVSVIKADAEKEAAKLKTDAAKEKKLQAADTLSKFFSEHNRSDIEKVVQLMRLIVEAKMILLRKLESLNKIKTFVQTTTGYRVTSGEGYVIADHLGKNAVKLVDRLEFSRTNFDPNTIRGWMKNK